MEINNLTLGDVLPQALISKYSAEVMQVSLEEAYNIVKYDMPPTTPLSSQEIQSIRNIYAIYESKADTSDPNAPYWNKSESENQAYWSKESY
jgi:hypothetical protein